TRLLQTHRPLMPELEVLEAGTMTTIQDWPGRCGLWDVGIPPSGPMDALAFRLANRLVGNAEGVAGLEMTATGATLRFMVATRVALAGTRMQARLDGADVPWWQAFTVPAGATLSLGAITGAGQRTY